MLELNGTLIAVIANFLILVWILNKFLYAPVRNALLERKNAIESDINSAKKKLEDASRLKADYDDRLGKSKEEAQAIIKNATAAGERIKGELLASAKNDALQVRAQAEKDATEIKKDALSSAKHQLSSLIVMAAGKIIGRSMDESLHKDILEDTVRKIDQVNLN